MRKSLTLLVVVVSGLALRAQESPGLWTLQDCIDYAIENNIALKRQEVLRDQYRYDLKEQKAGILPSLNFETNAYLNYGRSVSPEDNIITFEPNFNNSYGISSGVTLFNGFAKSNRISAARFLYKMGQEEVETQKNLLSLDIVNAYYQLLMARGLEESAVEQVEVTGKQLARIKLLVETGKESKTTFYELQSQLSSDRLLLTQAHNNSMLALESLRNLLQIEPGVAFDVASESDLPVVITEEMVDADSVYHIAKTLLPGIRALEYKTMAREKELAVYRGLKTPAVNFFAGWRTAYFNALSEGVDPVPFSEQVRNNNNPYFGINLSIPIFNRWANQRNVKRAKLNLEDSNLEMEQEYNDLYRQVTTACLELSASRDEYLAAKDNLEFNTVSYDAVEKKLTVGLANATEYAEARRQYFSAEINMLRTQLQYNLKMITLRFYQTGDWNF